MCPLVSQLRGTEAEQRSRTGTLPWGAGRVVAGIPRAEKPPGKTWWRKW